MKHNYHTAILQAAQPNTRRLGLVTVLLFISMNVMAGTAPTGSITISKNVDNDEFADTPFDFTLDGNPFSISENGGTYTAGELSPGSHNITELVPDGWDLTSINCGINQNNTGAVNGVNVILEEGEQVSCTFNNTKLPTGSITISKNVDNDEFADTSFDFTIEGDPFSISESGGSYLADELEAGIYNITELVPDGWDLTSINCGVDQNNTGAADGVNVVLEADEDVSCTFNNVINTATIAVTKNFDDNNPKNVTVELSCETGSVDPLSAEANDNANSPEDGPLTASFVVTGFTAGASCTVTETEIESVIEIGGSYTADTSNCTSTLGSIQPAGNYECEVVNQQDPATLTINVAGGGPVDLEISCTDGSVATPATTSASEGSPAIISVTDFPWDGASCSATVTGYPNGTFVSDNSCSDVQTFLGSAELDCAISVAETSARFEVTKEFTDGNNPTLVDVEIDCNTGLILDQDKTINENGSVNFVVTSFTDGALNCVITENSDSPDLLGYTPTYEPSGPSSNNGNNGDSCTYSDVTGGSQDFCHIINDADPVDVVIEKDWFVEGSGGNAIDQEFALTLYCNNVESNVKELEGCGFGGDYLAPGNLSIVGPAYNYCEGFEGNGDSTFSTQVTPRWPSGNCWVVEEYIDDYVEVDNGCQDLDVSHGQGDSCLITNTVFFEGIPALSRSGLAILALVMLTMGLFGFRRMV